MPPTLANGKICYLELPALDAAQSADFYAKVFGWSMRTRGDGTQAFDDTTGQVSGAFVLGRPSSPTPGLLFYIMVDSAVTACRAIEAHGGVIVQPIGVDAPEVTARFRDPAGNIIGVYQEPSSARAGRQFIPAGALRAPLNSSVRAPSKAASCRASLGFTAQRNADGAATRKHYRARPKRAKPLR